MSDTRPAGTVYARIGMRPLSRILLLTTAFAVAWALTVYMNMPWAAACIMAAAIGGTLYRVARVNGPGMILWCLAVGAFSTAGRARLRGEADGLTTFCTLAGVILFLTSSVVFLAAAWKHRLHRVANCACCNLALFTLIAWGAGHASISSRVRHQDAVQHTTETIVTLHKLAADLEAIRARLGRLPHDQEELVAVRQKPMPAFDGHFQIRYHRLDQDRYYLTCSLSDFWGRHWDLFGWIVSYYGPNSPRRIQVVPF